MNFTTPLFFYFFVIVFLVRWALPQGKNGSGPVQIFLLFASYVFYMSWELRFGALLFLITLSDFILGQLIHKTGKKIYLLLSLVIDLGVLSFFKYSHFFVHNLAVLMGIPGLEENGVFRNLVLPLGISFYVFQSMAYTIDVFRKETVPETGFVRYALFLSFFPQLVAGPVVSSRILLPQFKKMKEFSEIRWKQGMYYLVQGFVKKSVLADSISVYPDKIFQSPEIYSWEGLLTGVVAYSLQIYLDFSGYTDMAIGLGHLLGFELPENFRMPYLSRSLSEFWRRWHMTLSGWLKSYLYISLGGNRISPWMTYRNLLLTMLLGGLWHGASWNFVIWGGMHGVVLALERLVRDYFPGFGRVLPEKTGRFFSIMGIVVTFSVVSLLWVFFRAENFSSAFLVLQGLMRFRDGAGVGSLIPFGWVLGIVAAGHWIGISRGEKIRQLLADEERVIPVVAMAIVAVLAVLFSSEARPFIYFVF